MALLGRDATAISSNSSPESGRWNFVPWKWPVCHRVFATLQRHSLHWGERSEAIDEAGGMAEII